MRGIRGYLAHCFKPGDWFELAAIKKGEPIQRDYFQYDAEDPSPYAWALRHNETHNVYAVPNSLKGPSKRFKRAHNGDVARCEFLVVDCDPTAEAEKRGDGEQKAYELAYRLQEYLERRGVTGLGVFSGRGRQLLIRHSATVDPEFLDVRVRLLRGLKKLFASVEGAVVDTSTSNMATLARLPGTVNHKTGKRAEIMNGCGQTVPLDLLAEIANDLNPPPPPRAPYEPGKDAKNGGEAKARAVLETVCNSLAATSKGGRNNAAYRAAVTVGGWARFLDAKAACEALVSAALSAGLEHHRAMQSVDNGWTWGAARPWPLPEREPRGHPKPKQQRGRAEDAGRGDEAHEEEELVEIDYGCLEDVQDLESKFLWFPFLPIGEICLFTGAGGVGKSTFMNWLTAMVTIQFELEALTSRPNNYDHAVCIGGAPRNVVIFSGEDSLGKTVKRRISVLGGNRRRVFFPRLGEEKRELCLADLAVLNTILTEKKPALVVFDPIQSYLGAEVDMHRVNEIRPLLDGIAKLAEKHECCVVAICHLNKSSGQSAANRVMGSVDFVNRSRSVITAGRMKDGRTGIKHTKSNLARFGPDKEYMLGGEKVFAWSHAPFTVTEEELIGGGKTEKRSKTEEAADWLRVTLEGGQRTKVSLKAEAEADGLSWSTVERAAKGLVTKLPYRDPDGSVGGSMWTLQEAAV